MKVYAERHSDETALICGASGRKLTYKEVFTQAAQLGRSLQERGYRKGDVAAILSPNLPEYFITLLGCWSVRRWSLSFYDLLGLQGVTAAVYKAC